VNRLPQHLQPPTANAKRPLPIALAALHEIAAWHQEKPLTHSAEVARAALAELGIHGPADGGTT
jgi:hypothetical protein